ncbi:hypothetical protein HAX54_045486, partial [Datura stramonium]|nr:hypothetical protein [Datura stramonium]
EGSGKSTRSPQVLKGYNARTDKSNGVPLAEPNGTITPGMRSISSKMNFNMLVEESTDLRVIREKITMNLVESTRKSIQAQLNSVEEVQIWIEEEP